MSIVEPASPTAPPEVGQLVVVRDRHWVVSDIAEATQAGDALVSAERGPQTLVQLVSVEDDGFGDHLRVIWEVEPGARVEGVAALPAPKAGGFDNPSRLDAFLDAVRWGAITSADQRALQAAPFRSGISSRTTSSTLRSGPFRCRA